MSAQLSRLLEHGQHGPTAENGIYGVVHAVLLQQGRSMRAVVCRPAIGQLYVRFQYIVHYVAADLMCLPSVRCSFVLPRFVTVTLARP